MPYADARENRLQDLLESSFHRILDGDVFQAMEDLVGSLDAIRRASDAPAWRETCQALRRHPLLALIHQAPFTQRAFAKPRGYAGDAVTLDYIYGLERLAPNAPATVRGLYAWEYQTSSCRSVRARKALLAEAIDAAGSRSPRPRILSLACGHLREGEETDVLLDRRAAAFFAVDPDAESLALVASELRPYGVEPLRGSVRSVLTNRIACRDLDLAYAAGLYDYLADPVAIQLTAKLFAMLTAGGRLLIPNFNPALRDISYLEAFMDWWLLYRTDTDMTRLLGAIPESDIADSRLFRDRHGNITFLEVTRR